MQEREVERGLILAGVGGDSDAHGRRNSGNAAGQWQTHDVIVAKTADCPAGAVGESNVVTLFCGLDPVARTWAKT